MSQVTLGSTGITVNKNGFGALPIQRTDVDEAVRILHKALAGGITFYDTARVYSDSEYKLGLAFSPQQRASIYLASKSMSKTPEGILEDLDTTLGLLKTDYLDLYQLHNIEYCPKPDDGTGVYEVMERCKREGRIRHIGITNHRLGVAREAIESGMYATLQFPLNYLSTEQDLELVDLCKQRGMGFIAMKGLSGGLLNNAAAAYAFMDQPRLADVLPIWGIQHEKELDEFLGFMRQPPELDEALQRVIETDREQLRGNFCRGCGYCLPCPAKINIPMAARMMLFLGRAPVEHHTNEQSIAMMRCIEDCVHCGHCVKHCPYGLDTPALLAEQYERYNAFLAAMKG